MHNERDAVELGDGRHEEAISVSLRNVSKRYQTRTGSIEAVQGMTLDVRTGEFMSVVGPSGCGKSTLMMMMAGLSRASEGEISIHGRSVKEPYTDAGIVFQRDVLFDWRTVLGNVLMQAEFRKLKTSDYKDRALELLESVGLAGFAEKYPFELSGGMRQRVSICRALLHNPDLLFMDEPFGALDALTREKMNSDLQDLCQEFGKTVLFITHSIFESVFLSDRVVVMTPRPGQIADIIDIDLPRPRTTEVQKEPEFAAYTGRIHDIFRDMGVFD